MTVKDWTKAIISLGVLCSMTFLMYTGKVPGEAGVPLIAALLGYVFGNAHGVIESRAVAK